MPFIREFGSWLPERVVTSEEAGAWVGSDAEWVRTVSGIDERRFAKDEESVSDMAAWAGLDCLERAGVPASALGMVIVASSSFDRCFPGPAAETALKLGVPGIPALDITMASAGSLFALALARRLTNPAGPILVIGAEKMSSVVTREPQEKGVAILFGDGAGAALVMTEAAAVVPEGRISPQDVGIWNDAQVAAWARMSVTFTCVGNSSSSAKISKPRSIRLTKRS